MQKLIVIVHHCVLGDFGMSEMSEFIIDSRSLACQV